MQTTQVTRRELFALHFSLRLMQAKPNKFDKKKFEVGLHIWDLKAGFSPQKCGK